MIQAGQPAVPDDSRSIPPAAQREVMVAGGNPHRHDGSISAATAEMTGSAGEQGNPAGKFLSPDPVRRLDQFRLSEGTQSHNRIQSGRYVSAAGGEPDFFRMDRCRCSGCLSLCFALL